jgi:hypothetical protein
MTDFPAYGNSQPVTKIRRRTFEALKRLDGRSLQELVNAHFISEGEKVHILSTARGIVSYFQKLVDTAVKNGTRVDEILLDE